MREGPTNRISRHQFLKIVAGGAIGVTLPRIACAQSPGPTTRVYKTVGKCQIKADVHQDGPRRPQTSRDVDSRWRPDHGLPEGAG